MDIVSRDREFVSRSQKSSTVSISPMFNRSDDALTEKPVQSENVRKRAVMRPCIFFTNL